MTLYQKFKELNINHSAIGLEQNENCETYYCTPKGAEILGWAGVDGIHYCTIPVFGEMIFAVSPMNFGDCVHPIARNFEDLLRMLLYCADIAPLEQCYAWDEEQFKAFLLDYSATEEQQTVLDVIQKEFHLEPMEDTFAYVKKLQAEFDLSQIPYTEDYYDVDMNPAASVEPAQWKVTYDGGFWDHDGDAGVEIAIGKTFYWGAEKWYIPAVYICDEGLVIDFFMEADPADVKVFIEKWDLYNEDCNHYTEEQREQMRREHPLKVDFFGKVTCNGHELKQKHGCGLTWLSTSCLPPDCIPEPEAKWVLEHYGLDVDKAWSIRRFAYSFEDLCQPEKRGLESLSIRMVRNPEKFTGQHFFTPAVGESVSLTHPLTGQVYMLTVHEVEQQELPEHLFRHPNMEYPTHLIAMRYSLEPDIHDRGFMIQDCAKSDRPQQKERDPNVAFSATSVGIIGGADGPTGIVLGHNTATHHAVCSALHFEPVEEVEWRAVFSEKMMDDVDVELI